MKKILVVVDMQNDFIDGALGSEHAAAVVDKVCEKIKGWDGDIVYTLDTHTPEDYPNTTEGKDLPIPHCMIGSDGHKLNTKVRDALQKKLGRAFDLVYHEYTKQCFGSVELAAMIGEQTDFIELIGLCTDVCVISNAVILRNWKPNMRVVVDASCCAGVTPESHKVALAAMKCCGIQVIGDE